jgi:hypothetical protein
MLNQPRQPTRVEKAWDPGDRCGPREPPFQPIENKVGDPEPSIEQPEAKGGVEPGHHRPSLTASDFPVDFAHRSSLAAVDREMLRPYSLIVLAAGYGRRRAVGEA